MKFLSAWMKRYSTGPVDAVETFSPAPLLNAFEQFHGSFFDLDRHITISAGELKNLRAELSIWLTQQGLAPGSRLVVALSNGPIFAAVLAASLEAGASPILVHSDTPELELHRLAQRWGAQFLLTAAAAKNETGSSFHTSLLSGENDFLRCQTVADEPSGSDRVRLRSVPLHPTSGTSGGPKIAARPGPCAIAEAMHYIETLSIDESDVILCSMPMSHAYAYGMCLMVALLTSANLLFTRRFNPTTVAAALNQERVSIFPAVPFMLDWLLAAKPAITARPRVLLSAGAPLSRKTFEGFRDGYGFSVRRLYGTTETGGISIGAAEQEFDDNVGPPMQGVEVGLDAFSGAQSRAGAATLRVRSSSMMAGYLEKSGIRNPLHQGWFETGDLARFDAKGRIHLQGRLSEVINVFGFKVAPGEVEEVISLLPQVVEVKVYADHSSGPDVVGAAVVCQGQLTEAEVLRHCEKHLVSYKWPKAR
jgi:acyl-CoA synthetase (AMP-forming)/AMP-acid ligase II